MIYLDSAANSKVNEEVIDTYTNAIRTYFANPNSTHQLGLKSKAVINESLNNIGRHLNVNVNSIIITSGASEANNLVVKGLSEINSKKHIIISPLEHSSIITPVNYLQYKGYDVDILSLDENGQVNLDELKNLINENTLLVSVVSVDSELGIIQPIKEIANIVNKYDNCYFHTDYSQAMGKLDIDFNLIDFVTIAPHKFNGINNIGVLLKKENIKIIPQIMGGKSTTTYRSGTPDVASIKAFEKALEINILNRDKNNTYLNSLKEYTIKKLSTVKNAIINNNNKHSINSTINFSIIGKKSSDIQKALSDKEIYVSTKSACSDVDGPSKAIMALSANKERALSSIRISISIENTKEEIDILIKELMVLTK